MFSSLNIILLHDYTTDYLFIDWRTCWLFETWECSDHKHLCAGFHVDLPGRISAPTDTGVIWWEQTCGHCSFWKAVRCLLWVHFSQSSLIPVGLSATISDWQINLCRCIFWSLALTDDQRFIKFPQGRSYRWITFFTDCREGWHLPKRLREGHVAILFCSRLVDITFQVYKSLVEMKILKIWDEELYFF